MSAPLLPLELRLELLNDFGNAKDDFLNRLYDRRSIVERYNSLEIDLHVHFVVRDKGVWCANFWKREFGVTGVGGSIKEHICTASELWKFPVFVFVREVRERSRPIASFVRLEPLESCDMGIIDALAPSLLFPGSELVFRVYDRKLREILRRAGIKFCYLESKILKSGTEIVANFSDSNGDAHRSQDDAVDDILAVLPTVGLEMSQHSISLFPYHPTDQLPQILKVFACPHDPLTSGLKRMNKWTRGHAIIPT